MKSQNNKNYLLTNTHGNFSVEFLTALPTAKRAKTLTLKNKKTTMVLNGRQINVLKKLFVKENTLNGRSSAIY
jgi:hypothetical protein